MCCVFDSQGQSFCRLFASLLGNACPKCFVCPNSSAGPKLSQGRDSGAGQSFLRSGMTLVEVLVVIAIVSLLAGLSLMAVMRSRGAAVQLTCKDNLRQIGLATQNFIDAEDRFPYNRSKHQVEGMVFLLPFLEQSALFDRYIHASWEERRGMGVPSIFLCEADFETELYFSYLPCGGQTSSSGATSLGGFSKNVGFYHQLVRKRSQITDGLSNTVFYSERLVMPSIFPADFQAAVARFSVFVDRFVDSQEAFDQVCWTNSKSNDISLVQTVIPVAGLTVQFPFGTAYTPNSVSCEFGTAGLYPPGSLLGEAASYSVSSLHGGFVNASFGDGSVRTISDDIERSTWMAAGTIAGEESAQAW